MEAFATVDDLLAVWPGKTMDDAERTAAEALLMSATAQLTALLTNHGIDIVDGDEVQAENLKGAVCAMVRDAMDTPPAGVASMQQNIGSTTASVSWNNPNGAFYLSRHWKTVLGLMGGGKYREVQARTYACVEAV